MGHCEFNTLENGAELSITDVQIRTRRGIVSRDVHPANLVLDAGGRTSLVHIVGTGSATVRRDGNIGAPVSRWR